MAGYYFPTGVVNCSPKIMLLVSEEEGLLLRPCVKTRSHTVHLKEALKQGWDPKFDRAEKCNLVS